MICDIARFGINIVIASQLANHTSLARRERESGEPK
jgi:hypothetical protein